LGSQARVSAGESGIELVIPVAREIAGQVLYADGRAVQRAEVRAYSERIAEGDARLGDRFGLGVLAYSVADTHGAFRLSGVYEDRCTVEVVPELATDARVMVASVRAGDMGAQIVVRQGGEISGRLLGARDHGKSRYFLVLAWMEGKGRPYLGTYHGEDETFHFWRLPVGCYSLAAVSEDGRIGSAETVSASTGQVGVRIKVATELVIRKLVTDTRGRPIDQRLMLVRRWDGEGRLGVSLLVRSGRAGEIVLGGLRVGEHIFVRVKGSKREGADLVVTPSEKPSRLIVR